MGGSQAGWPGHKRRTLFKKITKARAGGVAQMVECLHLPEFLAGMEMRPYD
jgi:hypothetical protein